MPRMRKQYNFWPGEQELDARDVDRLIELSAALPVKDVVVDAIADVDTDYWFTYGPRCRLVEQDRHDEGAVLGSIAAIR